MTDLSYTNKDGLNLYEGFNNGFDYHRDGADDTDGYAHGGYPHIDGETSEYTDTSYKTGDPDDFFGNGNTFNIIPRSGGSGYEFTIKPTSEYIGDFSISSGQWFPYEENELYNISYDGVLYENIKAESGTFTWMDEETRITFVGNPDLLLNRSRIGRDISPYTEKQGTVDNGLPFAFMSVDGEPYPHNGCLCFLGEAADHIITITSVSDSSKTYSLEIESSDVETTNEYFIPEASETIIQKLEIENNKLQNIIVNDVVYSGKWEFSDDLGDEMYLLMLDGYSQEDYPIYFSVGTIKGEPDRDFNSAAIPSEISSDVQVTIPKM